MMGLIGKNTMNDINSSQDDPLQDSAALPHPTALPQSNGSDREEAKRQQHYSADHDQNAPDSAGSVNEAGNGFGINAGSASASWQKRRGPLALTDEASQCVGRVGCPSGQEATSAQFCFWIPEDALVEATQIVTVPCRVAGKDMRFYALIEEVHRCSRTRGMGHEVDMFDGDLGDDPPFASEGITYGKAAILRSEPAYLTPPRERSHVLLAGCEDAGKAYGADEIDVEKRLPVGLIRNGGAATAGPGFIDLDYLLGANGGHLNVSGSAGRATKSSFLLTIVYLLLAKSERDKRARPSASDRLRVVPIIFNVKNYDLFHIDRPSRKYDAVSDRAGWAELGVPSAVPFIGTTYLAPQRQTISEAVDTGRRSSDVQPYSWCLRDIVEGGLLPYLFSDEDAGNDNFLALVYDLENLLTEEHIEGDGSVTRHLTTTLRTEDSQPVDTLRRLTDWLRSPAAATALGGRDHHDATRKKLSRRLLKLLYESNGVLRADDRQGNPLDVRRRETTGPIVVDLNGLAGQSNLQRFVVATVLRQLVDSRTGAQAVNNLKYLVVLDELNRFAPKTGRDPITKLIETVAGEMRSQGILLFGAQQQASMVSARVIENSAIKVLGQTGAQELQSGVWGGLSDAARRRVAGLMPGEKIVLAPGFRQPMHVSVPRPPWAMNREEAADAPAAGTNDGSDDLASFGDA